MHATAKTSTGGFPIGLRLTGTMADRPVAEIATWSAAAGFGCVDLPALMLATVPQWRQAGLSVGTLDLFGREWSGMLSADAAMRRATVAQAERSIRAAAAAGVKVIFVVMLAADVNLPRKETFGYMVETYGALRDVLKATGVRIAIEGWPGCNAHCCTPESYRAFLREMDSTHFGINYDPSHLLRMGIDPRRFLKEFAPQVVHVHGKDTLIDADRLYNHGTEQAGFLTEAQRWGGWFWRYTIPGRGQAPWSALLGELVAVKYQGFVSIELEDLDFNGTLDGEKRGFLAARDFLQSA